MGELGTAGDGDTMGGGGLALKVSEVTDPRRGRLLARVSQHRPLETGSGRSMKVLGWSLYMYTGVCVCVFIYI